MMMYLHHKQRTQQPCTHAIKSTGTPTSSRLNYLTTSKLFSAGEHKSFGKLDGLSLEDVQKDINLHLRNYAWQTMYEEMGARESLQLRMRQKRKLGVPRS